MSTPKAPGDASGLPSLMVLSDAPTQADPAARERMIAIAAQGLRNP